MNRLEQLRQFAKEEPEDPFNLYALALEYLKSDQKEALNIFKRLLEKFPEYLPTYYPYAQLLAETKERKLAENVFEAGIEVAKKLNDLKTIRELQAAYNDLRYEG
ncbi:MAG TPA: tetratricopeptide repeat protein [Cyclobacteriaceae bacterium]|nr:tetratricopeptide repeat protein [Cyclobacteriaceae bacterium]